MANHQFALDSVQPTPMNARTMKLFPAFSLWLGSNVVVTTVYTGQLLVPDISYLTALCVILFGSLVGAIFLVLTGNIGTRTGLPTMVLTRGAFGTRGAHLPSLLNTIVLIGWSWVQAYMGGLSIDHAVKYLTGYSNINFWTVFTQVMVVLITIYGHKGIETFASLAAHFMVILVFLLFGYLFTEYNVGDLIHLPTSHNPTNTVITGFDIVVATAFSWLPLACDYNRNATSSKTGIIGTYAGYNIGTFLAMALGATVSGLSILSHMTQTYDPTDIIGSKHPWLGLLPALIIFISVVSTNVMALYSSTMSYLAVFQKQKYLVTTIVIGVITILGALLKGWLLDHFENFLLMIGTLLIPVGALLIVDYYLLKRGYYDPDEIINGTKKLYWYFKGFNVYTYISYIIGAGFGYYFTYVYVLPTGSTILTFLVTSVVYWGLSKLRNEKVAEQENSGQVSIKNE